MSNPAATPLGSMLTPQTVRAKVAAASWQQAVDRVGALLVEARAIEPGYIEAMKRVLQEMGPYAVIAPGIVLLHARPEDGVLRPCLGLTTLAKPVRFGHTRNDPVDVVLAMGAVDKSAHVVALQQLALLLGDAPTLDRIRSAIDDDQLLSALLSWSPGAAARPPQA
jgi:mannitol/fructose-specific phosphotransferase system IIA component (Ntr-type)